MRAVFEKHGATPALEGYHRIMAELLPVKVRGFLTGFIDLAFEHGGRWHVLDYKSNHLGPHPSSYRFSPMLEAMREHHYLLQYHIYVVALHRHLGRIVPGYDYDAHMGGVYYLFLRGMDPDHPSGNGVFADRPSRALVEELDGLMGGGR
jgi:exodeoxyribonuclease V beta subunit